MKKSFLIFILPLFLLNCTKKVNPAISKIDIQGHEVNLLNYSELAESQEIKSICKIILFII